MNERCPTCRGPLIGDTHVVRIGDDWAPRAARTCSVNTPAEPPQAGPSDSKVS